MNICHQKYLNQNLYLLPSSNLTSFLIADYLPILVYAVEYYFKVCYFCLRSGIFAQ